MTDTERTAARLQNMQPGQVSVWVPVVVGLIGVLGIVTGQLVSAWKERKREELRWKRELQSLKTRLQLDDIHQWREIKIRTYGQLLQTLWEMMRGLSFLAQQEDHFEPIDKIRNKFDRFEDALADIFGHISQAMIIGSRETVQALRSFDKVLLPEITNLSKLAHGHYDDDATSDKLEEIIIKLSEVYSEVMQAVRSELDVTPIENLDASPEK